MRVRVTRGLILLSGSGATAAAVTSYSCKVVGTSLLHALVTISKGFTFEIAAAAATTVLEIVGHVHIVFVGQTCSAGTGFRCDRAAAFDGGSLGSSSRGIICVFPPSE